MKYLPTLSSPCFLTGALLASLCVLSPGVQAQTATVTYDLKDVWLKPDITHPREKARQMTGTFVWTYPVGKFDGGTGKFTSLYIPWWGRRTTPGIKVTFDLKSIEFSMIGNYHGLGVDVMLRLSPPLSQHRASPIDRVRSKFTLEVGIVRKGHITKGSIVPRCQPPKNYGSGTAGSGKFVPTIANSGGDARIGNSFFRIDCDRLLGGTSCFFLLGAGKAQFQFIGVTVLVDPKSLILVPLQASGRAGVPGAGALRIPTPIPNDSRLIAASIYFQVVAIDPGSPGRVASATNGLNVVICQ